MPLLKKTMFREYDLRGRESKDELNDESVYYLGRGFGAFLSKQNLKETIEKKRVRWEEYRIPEDVTKGREK